MAPDAVRFARSLREEAEEMPRLQPVTSQDAAPAPGCPPDAAVPPPQGDAKAWRGVYDIAGILERAGSTGPRFRTGLEVFDEALTPKSDPTKRGLPLGRIVAYVGEPWRGKSLLMNQTAGELARQGLRVVLLVMDEPREDAAERLGQGLGFAHRELNADHPDVLGRLRMATAEMDINILPDEDEEKPHPTIEDAAAFLRSKPNAVGYVFGLDSLHRVRSATESERDDQRTQIEKRMAALRNLRREGVLVLFTAEAGRASYASKNPDRRQSPLAAGAESRAIEYGSDVLLFLSAADGDLVRGELAKNRPGRQRATFSLRLDPGPAKFEGVTDEILSETEDAGVAEKRVTRLKRVGEKILRQLKKNPDGMTTSALRAVVAARSADISPAIEVLEEAGEVFNEPRSGKGGGIVWRLALARRTGDGL
jgi:KaiC/GvpD/RAD55 family RecA-like ATPase